MFGEQVVESVPGAVVTGWFRAECRPGHYRSRYWPHRL